VASVVVDTGLPHLDRPFDYLVSGADDAACVPGCRVRVRFAGRLVDGFVLARAAQSAHTGTLAFLAKVLSAEPVLAPEIAVLARAVADRYAGSMSDVLRLAVPPRHAATEKAATSEKAAPGAEDVDPGVSGASGASGASAAPGSSGAAGGLTRYVAGPALLDAVRAGRSPRAVWSALPGTQWPFEIAALVAASTASGRGSLVVVPDARDIERVVRAVPGALALRAEAGPAERYRRFLAVSRGQARVVVGTRAAVYAPVAALGLIVVWDEGDDLHAEPRAPYPHARDVALMRAHQQGAAVVLGGHALTAEAAQLLSTGWAHPLAADRAVVREVAPRVVVAGDDFEQERDPAAAAARLPSLALRTAREALRTGPVLVQVPRRGYLPGLVCGRCRTSAHCTHCGGPLSVAAANAIPACRWCGRPNAHFSCSACGFEQLRAGVYGERRTAEEIGRALPGVPVRTSGRDQVLATVSAEPAVVVSTPGAEPVAAGDGYAAVLLLDGWSLLGRPDLRAGEEALRRWANAAALAAPRAPVVIMADAAPPPVQALVRWDPAGHAARELAERAELGFPPAVRMAAVDGEPVALQSFLAVVELPDSAELLGPVPLPEPEKERALIRVPRTDSAALARALHAAAAIRSARKDQGAVRIQLDPPVLG
jgi:primosomal protein N' (replication factor Y)